MAATTATTFLKEGTTASRNTTAALHFRAGLAKSGVARPRAHGLVVVSWWELGRVPLPDYHLNDPPRYPGNLHRTTSSSGFLLAADLHAERLPGAARGAFRETWSVKARQSDPNLLYAKDHNPFCVETSVHFYESRKYNYNYN